MSATGDADNGLPAHLEQLVELMLSRDSLLQLVQERDDVRPLGLSRHLDRGDLGVTLKDGRDLVRGQALHDPDRHRTSVTRELGPA